MQLGMCRNTDDVFFFFTLARKQRKTANESGQPPSEAKLLDDLFRRTKASPSIYWLPLSEEQVNTL